MESSDAIGKLLRAEEKYVMVSISRFQIHRLHLIYVCMYGMCVCMCVLQRSNARQEEKSAAFEKEIQALRATIQELTSSRYAHTYFTYPTTSFINTYIHLLRVV